MEDTMLASFINRAQAGENVYLFEVRNAFDRMEGAPLLRCVLELADGSAFELAFRVPHAGTDREKQFVRRYVYARIYNALVLLGGTQLTVYAPDGELSAIAKDLPAVFGMGVPRAKRTGYGKCVNVISRMNEKLCGRDFSIRTKSPGDYSPAPAPARERRAGALDAFRRAVQNLSGRVVCGIDIGGTDIKVCVSDGGALVFLKEYDWHPARFPRIDLLIDPICTLVRFARDCAALRRESAPAPAPMALAAAMRRDAPCGEIRACCERLEAALGDRVQVLDAVGMCYPDVVIRNKIVGGETSKTAAVRANPAVDYEAEFRRIMDLDDMLRALCRPGGLVRCINDGPMAAYTAAVELSCSPHPESVQNGVFAHALGTEPGTGWIDENGRIPDLPLEGYNLVVDLGSLPEAGFPPEDVRSVRNLNTGISGTMQKYAGQGGVFRLAARDLPAACPNLYAQLLGEGFFERRADGLYVPESPRDLRKPLLERLMALAGAPDAPEALREIFRKIGESLAAMYLETRDILRPATEERMLFGRLVKNPACFSLLCEGASRVSKTLTLTLADSGIAFTPLMRQLRDHPTCTVAQFAQSIGAAHFAAAAFQK